MHTHDYLDAAKSKLGITSDYALAKNLNITKEALSHLRHRKIYLSEKMALRLSKILEIDPLEILIADAVDRSKEPETRATWLGLLEKISSRFQTLLLPANPRGDLISA